LLPYASLAMIESSSLSFNATMNIQGLPQMN